MSKKVETAAAQASSKADAKAPADKNKPATQANDQAPAKEEQEVVDKELEEGTVVNDEAGQQQEAAAETTLGADFSFEGALADAAASAGSLISEAEAVDEAGFGLAGDGDATGTILLVGAVALVGLGIYALVDDGGSKNEAPSFADATLTVTTPEDTALQITPAATDPDGDTLTYTASDPENGTVTVGTGGVLTFTPDADFFGTTTFVITATDPDGATATQTVTVNVTPVNDAPTAVDDEVTTDEDTPITIDVLENDFDAEDDPFDLTGVGEAENGTVVLNEDGTVTYTPDADFNGTDTFTYTLTYLTEDETEATVTGTVTVTVDPVNDAPVFGAESVDIEVDEGDEISGQVQASDVDDDAEDLVYSVATDPENGTLTIQEDGSYTYTPNEGFSGSDSFEVLVTDPGGLTDVLTVNVTVIPDAISLDGLGTAQTSANVDASGGAFVFTDDASVNTFVNIQGFSTDDVIQVTNVPEGAAYAFTTGVDPNDLSITFAFLDDPATPDIDETANNVILIEGILEGSDSSVFDYASAVAAVQEATGDSSYVFMTFA